MTVCVIARSPQGDEAIPRGQERISVAPACVVRTAARRGIIDVMNRRAIFALGCPSAVLVLTLALGALAARGESLASHRDGRGAPLVRRDDREYREYSSEEQRSQTGCSAGRMQRDFHHGLLGAVPSRSEATVEKRKSWRSVRSRASVLPRLV